MLALDVVGRGDLAQSDGWTTGYEVEAPRPPPPFIGFVHHLHNLSPLSPSSPLAFPPSLSMHIPSPHLPSTPCMHLTPAAGAAQRGIFAETAPEKPRISPDVTRFGFGIAAAPLAPHLTCPPSAPLSPFQRRFSHADVHKYISEHPNAVRRAVSDPKEEAEGVIDQQKAS